MQTQVSACAPPPGAACHAMPAHRRGAGRGAACAGCRGAARPSRAVRLAFSTLLRCSHARLGAQGMFYPQQGGYPQQTNGFGGGYGKKKNKVRRCVVFRRRRRPARLKRAL